MLHTLRRPLREREFALAVDPKGHASLPTAQDTPGDAGKAFQDCRVLLVDDNAINRRVAGAMLKKLGMTVEEANDGLQAVVAYAQRTFDLIFMDISVPVLDGPAALAKIRKEEQQAQRSRTPIIALTAHALEGDTDRYLAEGFDSYLTKPVDQAKLRETVAAMVAPLTLYPDPISRPYIQTLYPDPLPNPFTQPPFRGRYLGPLPGLVPGLVPRLGPGGAEPRKPVTVRP